MKINGIEYLTVKEAAGLIGVTVRTLSDWRSRVTRLKPTLPFHKIGKHVYYLEKDIGEWAQNQQTFPKGRKQHQLEEAERPV